MGHREALHWDAPVPSASIESAPPLLGGKESPELLPSARAPAAIETAASAAKGASIPDVAPEARRARKKGGRQRLARAAARR